MPSPRAKLGSWGEALACRMLRAKGYAILTTNYRCRWGEVDIIAQQNGELVFVEVRTRSGPALGTPEESLTAAKARRLIATAETYLQSLEAAPADWAAASNRPGLRPREQRAPAGKRPAPGKRG